MSRRSRFGTKPLASKLLTLKPLLFLLSHRDATSAHRNVGGIAIVMGDRHGYDHCEQVLI
jgi:hypothetical protein